MQPGASKQFLPIPVSWEFLTSILLSLVFWGAWVCNMHFAPVIVLIIKTQPAAYQQLQHTTHWDTACLDQVQERSVLKAMSQDKAFILKDTSLLQYIKLVISFQIQLGIWKSEVICFAGTKENHMKVSYHCLVMSNIITTPLQFL